MKFQFEKQIISLAFFVAFAQAANAQATKKMMGDSVVQLKIDSTLELKFNQIGKIFCHEYREIFEEQNKAIREGSLGGMAICEIAKADTLNVQELKYPGFEIEKTVLDSNCFEVFWIGAIMEDSLFEIKLGIPFGNQFIVHKINQNRVTSGFQEDYKDDKVVKMNKNEAFSNKINVPVKVSEFALSTNRFVSGELVFGFCEFETEPYFLKDMYLTPALHLKRTYRYYFKAKVQ